MNVSHTACVVQRTRTYKSLTLSHCLHYPRRIFFFFNDTATTEIYTLSLHDALPIYRVRGRRLRQDRSRHARGVRRRAGRQAGGGARSDHTAGAAAPRSEEHTSELQSQSNLVCRLLLEKKKK